MQHYSFFSQHLESLGDSDNFFAASNQPSTQDNYFSQEASKPTNSVPSNALNLSEKKLDLIKKMLLLQQRKKSIAELGDPSFLLDANFEVSPKNYGKLLDYTKKTAQKLNDLLAQSSDLFSNYLNGFQKSESHDSAEETLNYMCSPSLDSNSTRDSDQFSEHNMSSESSTPKQSMKVKEMTPKANKASWDKEKDKMLIKLVCKYNKDWKKVQDGLLNQYFCKFNIDFLRERYRELYYSNQKLSKYTQKSNNREYETPSAMDEEYAKIPQFIKKTSSNGFKQKQKIEATRKNLLENLVPETDNYNYNHNYNNFDQMNTNQEKESLQLFFNKEEHMASKTVEVPWISFDFDTEFGQQDQLFERVTPCFN